uniref:M-phase-specific PLK1-interacting protein n=1 Tax=Pristiophorus japonicus TaxID=55135 RepID=UPI00398EFA36
MFRPNFRPSPLGGAGPRPGFRSPPPGSGPFPGAGPAGGGGGGGYPWGSPTPPYGGRPRAYAKSPQQLPPPGPFLHQQHRYKSPSPSQQQQQSFTPRQHHRRYSSPPYQPLSPGVGAAGGGGGGGSPSPAHHRKYSPRTSTPFGIGSMEKRSPAPVEHYYKPSMLVDPWANLVPVCASDIDRQYSSPQTASTGQRGRYFT